MATSKSSLVIFKAYPPEHAEMAYRAGFYVEAIQVLHGWIEVKLQELFLLSRHKNLKHSYSEIWDSAFGIPLIQVAKVLLVSGKLDKPTFDAVNRFNSMRNKIIHKIFNEPYDSPAKPISKVEYDKAFTFGTELSWKLEGTLGKLATRGKVGERTPAQKKKKQGV